MTPKRPKTKGVRSSIGAILPQERLVEAVAEPYSYVRRWGLDPGRWTHELVWLPEGCFAAWAYRLENGQGVKHFYDPDYRRELVQGNWWRTTGRVVEMAALAKAANAGRA